MSTSASATGNTHYYAEFEALVTYAESKPELPHERLEHVVHQAAEALDKIRTENPHHFSSIMTRGIHTFYDGRAVTYNRVWAELFLRNECAETSKEWRTFYSRLFKLHKTHRSTTISSGQKNVVDELLSFVERTRGISQAQRRRVLDQAAIALYNTTQETPRSRIVTQLGGTSSFASLRCAASSASDGARLTNQQVNNRSSLLYRKQPRISLSTPASQSLIMSGNDSIHVNDLWDALNHSQIDQCLEIIHHSSISAAYRRQLLTLTARALHSIGRPTPHQGTDENLWAQLAERHADPDTSEAWNDRWFLLTMMRYFIVMGWIPDSH
ncbi:hypothetical protein IWZ03DRAFT_362774 [Phyllosticta citriasiana]|uniref:Uncharacterized protein n=1 Tax=Phyllosticta citriasiana TaxID=595635 RepID=A0ABR1KDN0_9PEZI